MNGFPASGQGLPMMTYEVALEIARSAHPSRVLANTCVYRYGQFTEDEHSGWVTVTMMGSHIATFRPDGVMLWSRGYVTVTTTEALNELVTGGCFYTHNRVIYFERYDEPRQPPDYARIRHEFQDGMLFPYRFVND